MPARSAATGLAEFGGGLAGPWLRTGAAVYRCCCRRATAPAQIALLSLASLPAAATLPCPRYFLTSSSSASTSLSCTYARLHYTGQATRGLAGWAPALELLGTIYSRLGDTSRAEEALRQAVELDPTASEAGGHLLELLMGQQVPSNEGQY